MQLYHAFKMEWLISLRSTCGLDLTNAKSKNRTISGTDESFKSFFHEQHAVTLDNIRSHERKFGKSKERFFLGKPLLSSILCIDNTVGMLKQTGDAWQWVRCMKQFTCVTHKSLLGSSE